MLLGILGILGLTAAGPVAAEDVSVLISGVVQSMDDPNGLLPADIVLGSPVQGIYRFDPQAALAAIENPPGSVLHLLDPNDQPSMTTVTHGHLYSNPIYGIGISDVFAHPVLGPVDMWVTGLQPAPGILTSLTLTDTTRTRIDDPLALFAAASLAGWDGAYLDLVDTSDPTPTGVRELARAQVQSLTLIPPDAATSVDDFRTGTFSGAAGDPEACEVGLPPLDVASTIRCRQVAGPAGTTVSLDLVGSGELILDAVAPGSTVRLRYPFAEPQNLLWVSHLLLKIETDSGARVGARMISAQLGAEPNPPVEVPATGNGAVWVAVPVDPRAAAQVSAIEVEFEGTSGRHRIGAIIAVPEPRSSALDAIGTAAVVMLGTRRVRRLRRRPWRP